MRCTAGEVAILTGVSHCAPASDVSQNSSSPPAATVSRPQVDEAKHDSESTVPDGARATVTVELCTDQAKVPALSTPVTMHPPYQQDIVVSSALGAGGTGIADQSPWRVAIWAASVGVVDASVVPNA